MLPRFLKAAVARLLRSAGYGVVRLREEDRLLGLLRFPIRTVIDVGANVGQFARRHLPLFPDARFLCVEPQPAAYARLASWVAGTGGRVQAWNGALGERAGTARMIVHRDHDASSSLLLSTPLLDELYPETSRHAEIDVPLDTLDALVGRELDPIRDDLLVKMDVQGYEDRVVAGGERTLGRALACITEVSLESLYVRQASFLDLCSRLAALGLFYAGNIEQMRDPDGRVVFIDALFVRRTP